MKFLVDENLPPRLAQWLRQRGHEALHIQDLALVGHPDEDVAAAALREDAIIVTQDHDFAAPRADSPRVVLIGLGNAKTADLLAWLDRRFDSALAALSAGDRLVRLE